MRNNNILRLSFDVCRYDVCWTCSDVCRSDILRSDICRSDVFRSDVGRCIVHDHYSCTLPGTISSGLYAESGAHVEGLLHLAAILPRTRVHVHGHANLNQTTVQIIVIRNKDTSTGSLQHEPSFV